LPDCAYGIPLSRLTIPDPATLSVTQDGNKHATMEGQMHPIVCRICLVAALAFGSPGGSASAQSAPDGGSFEKAIVIEATNERQGIAAEREWVNKNLPGWKISRQALLNGPGGRHYDRIELTGPDGARKTIFFDITVFFGKM
jgi:hypothetical protein